MQRCFLSFLSILLCAPLLRAQTEYTGDGTPSALEEEFRWIINRGRHDSAAENAARGTSYADIPASCGPLAPHASLYLSARHHADDMATFDFLSHTSVTSQYYTVGSSFSARMTAEGYNWVAPVAENLSAGSLTDVSSHYLAWWNSEGHRLNMYNQYLCEFGCGHGFNAASTYRNYFTIDLGTRSDVRLFTGTLFSDNDHDGTYDQGEGVGGIKVSIQVGGTASDWYDISADAGSFAVPITDVPTNVTAKVWLENTTSNGVTLTIPLDYSNSTSVALNAGSSTNLAAFVRASEVRTLGLRDLDYTSATPPVLGIWHAVEITWASQSGALYQVQWASALDTNQWFDLGSPVVGNGQTNSVFSGTRGTTKRFYRVVVP